MPKFIVTGGAGFIGSHMVSRLLKEGHYVKVIDKIQPDKTTRLSLVMENEKFSYSHLDTYDSNELEAELRGYDTVIHFAASGDISLGHKQTDLDLKQGTIVTYKVLEAMRLCGIKKIIYSSSSTIYGFPSKVPTPEDAGMLFPGSLYGASKLASEALISSFCYLFDMKSWIFRFGNVTGNNPPRGIILDLVHKLRKNPAKLEVLGDGEQVKDYININDCLDGILTAFSKTNDRINVFNLSSGTTVSVKEVVKMILQEMNLDNVKINYTGGPPGWDGGGWPGDIKIVHYDISKIKRIGWQPKLSSHEAIRLAIKGTIQNN